MPIVFGVLLAVNATFLPVDLDASFDGLPALVGVRGAASFFLGDAGVFLDGETGPFVLEEAAFGADGFLGDAGVDVDAILLAVADSFFALEVVAAFFFGAAVVLLDVDDCVVVSLYRCNCRQ